MRESCELVRFSAQSETHPEEVQAMPRPLTAALSPGHVTPCERLIPGASLEVALLHALKDRSALLKRLPTKRRLPNNRSMVKGYGRASVGLLARDSYKDQIGRPT